MEQKNKTLFLTQMGILTVIQVIFCFTWLGSIPIVPGAIVATTAHLPAIITALFLGKKAGIYMGGVMGVCALIYWTTIGSASPTAFCFIPWSPDGRGNVFSLLIAVVPRVVFPYITAIIFEAIIKKAPSIRKTAGAIAGLVGTLLHSVLVLGGIYLVFRGNELIGSSFLAFILAWGGVNALIEAFLGCVIGALAVSKIGIKKVSN